MSSTSNDKDAQRTLTVLPSRVTGPHTDSFRRLNVTTNHYEVKLDNISKIVIFRLKITPSIAADNRKLRLELMEELIPQLKGFIRIFLDM